jgi:hypothetical protein
VSGATGGKPSPTLDERGNVLTDVILGTCAECLAPNYGTKFCDACGAAAKPVLTDLVAVTAGWREPSRSTPLRWSNYVTRIRTGYGLVFAAFVISVFLRAQMDYFGSPPVALVLSAVVCAAGAIVAMPGRASRRVVGTVLVVAGVLLAGGTLGLAPLLVVIGGVAMVMAWLIVRQRPVVASWFLLLVPTVEVLRLLIYEGGGYNLVAMVGPIGFAIERGLTGLLGIVGVAWLARAVSPAVDRAKMRRLVRAEEQGVAFRTAQIQQWQLANERANSGMQKPALNGPALYPTYAYSAAPMNVMAVLALIFGLGGGLLGIIFGHIARSQIRRTGERGLGMATAGLVLGYAGLAVIVVLVVVAIVVSTNATTYYN